MNSKIPVKFRLWDEEHNYEPRAKSSLKREEKAIKLSEKYTKKQLRARKFGKRQDINNKSAIVPQLVAMTIIFTLLSSGESLSSLLKVLAPQAQYILPSEAPSVNQQPVKAQPLTWEWVLRLNRFSDGLAKFSAFLCLLAYLKEEYGNPNSCKENVDLELIEYALEIYDGVSMNNS